MNQWNGNCVATGFRVIFLLASLTRICIDTYYGPGLFIYSKPYFYYRGVLDEDAGPGVATDDQIYDAT